MDEEEFVNTLAKRLGTIVQLTVDAALAEILWPSVRGAPRLRLRFFDNNCNNCGNNCRPAESARTVSTL